MRQLLSKKKVYSKIALLFCAMAIVGFISNSLLPALLILSVALLLWHYHHLFILDKWLWQDRKLSPPLTEGIWGKLFEAIYYQQRKERRKQAQLYQVIRRFRDGAEALSQAIIVLNKDWSLMWCNKLAQHFIGISWPHDEGQRLHNLIRHPNFLLFIQQHNFTKTLELVSPVNEQLMLEFTVSAYGTEQYLLTIRDISQIKLLEQVRKDFVANVSHELRTPLTVLRGYLELMDDNSATNSKVWQQAQSVMLEQTKRMDGLVQQLLTLSQIEATTKVQFEPKVDVPAMLAQLKLEAASLNSEKQHKLSFSIDNSLMVMAISEELRSAFANLVSNAIKYTPAGGDIQVSWQRDNLSATFSVIDNGEGIAPQHVKRLTERFYRVDQARARSTGGTGLGLAIVKHILSRHQSRLIIASERGKGSCFSFSLPAELVLSD